MVKTVTSRTQDPAPHPLTAKRPGGNHDGSSPSRGPELPCPYHIQVWGQRGAGFLLGVALSSCPGWSRTNPPSPQQHRHVPSRLPPSGSFSPKDIGDGTGCVPCLVQSKTRGMSPAWRTRAVGQLLLKGCGGAAAPPQPTLANQGLCDEDLHRSWPGSLRYTPALGSGGGPGHVRTHSAARSPPDARRLFWSMLMDGFCFRLFVHIFILHP